MSFLLTFLKGEINISKLERHALYNDVLCNCCIKDREVWDESRKVFSWVLVSAVKQLIASKISLFT